MSETKILSELFAYLYVVKGCLPAFIVGFGAQSRNRSLNWDPSVVV